ncbi:hypothetical protein HDV57DRAFT_129075 [Trichoderma longibrachiatum]
MPPWLGEEESIFIPYVLVLRVCISSFGFIHCSREFLTPPAHLFVLFHHPFDTTLYSIYYLWGGASCSMICTCVVSIGIS